MENTEPTIGKTRKRLPSWDDFKSQAGKLWREKLQPHISYQHHPLFFTILLMVIMLTVVIWNDMLQNRNALKEAIANPRSFIQFTVMIQQQNFTTGEVLAWPENGDTALVKFGSPSYPLVYDLWYYRNFGTAKPGDKISFIWKTEPSNCLTVGKKGDLFLYACGLTPLKQGQ